MSCAVVYRRLGESGPTCFFLQVLEEFLIEDEGHAADLLHLGLRRRVSVDEVGCDGDGQFSPEFFPSKSCGKKKCECLKGQLYIESHQYFWFLFWIRWGRRKLLQGHTHLFFVSKPGLYVDKWPTLLLGANFTRQTNMQLGTQATSGYTEVETPAAVCSVSPGTSVTPMHSCDLSALLCLQ